MADDPMVRVSIVDVQRCKVIHCASMKAVGTAVTPEFGGPGDAFSSTDLVAAALGSCIGSSIAPVAERHDIRLTGIVIEVRKSLADKPRRIAALEVGIALPEPVDSQVLARLNRAAATCAVKASLHPDLEVRIDFLPFPAGSGERE